MVAHTTFLIGALVAPFVLANKILASVVHSEVLDPTCLSETLDHDISPAGTSTMVPVTGIPVATSITATSVIPQTTLPTNAMGSPPLLIEASRSGPRTPLRPLVIEWELVNHPNKVFVKQLISDLVHGCFIGYHGPQFQAIAKHLSSALQHTNIIDKSLRNRTHPWTSPLFSGGRFSPSLVPMLSQHYVNFYRVPMKKQTIMLVIALEYIGTATTAAAAGLPPALIKTLGRWKSNAYETYIQYPPSSLYAVSSLLSHADVRAQNLAWNPDNHIACIEGNLSMIIVIQSSV